MTPESGTRAEIKRWMFETLPPKVNHGWGLPRLKKKLQRGKRIFEIRKNRHLPHCLVGKKYYSLKFPFVHYRHKCDSICMCEIIALLRDLGDIAHDLSTTARRWREIRL